MTEAERDTLKPRKLWLVEIHEDDIDYDRFRSAVVWAETPEEAEALMRADTNNYTTVKPEHWVYPSWRLVVTEAPSVGVAHVHYRYG